MSEREVRGSPLRRRRMGNAASGSFARRGPRSPSGAGASSRRESGAAAKWVAILAVPAFILFVLAAYGLAAVMASRGRDVVLVNGLSVGYKVKINDTIHTIGPYEALHVKINEGDVSIGSVAGENVSIQEQTVAIRTPFLLRPFSKHAFVINPDLAAAIVLEKGFYSDRGEDGPESELKLYLGEALYEFTEINYLFVDFPDTVNVEPGQVLPRTQLELLSPEGSSLSYYYSNFEEWAELDKVLAAAGSHLTHVPDNLDLLQYLRGAMSPSALADLLHGGLEVRPVRINWHRYYQTARQQDPSHTLESEYRAMHEAEPDDAALSYLLGRISRDRAEAEGMLKLSTTGPKPCAYGFNAMAFQLMGEGKFEEAVLEQLAADYPDSATWPMKNVLLLAYQGVGHAAARTAIEKLSVRIVRGSDTGDATEEEKESTKAWQELLDRQYAYYSGQIALYTKLSNIAEAQAGEKKAAEAHLKSAIATLENGVRDEKMIAGWLSGSVAFNLDDLSQTAIDVEMRAVYLAAVGTAVADARDVCYARARRLNFPLYFPHQFLNTALAKK